MINSYSFVCFCAIMMIVLNNTDAENYRRNSNGPAAIKHLATNTSLLWGQENQHPNKICQKRFGKFSNWKNSRFRPPETLFTDDLCTQDIVCRIIGGFLRHEPLTGQKPAEGTECAKQNSSNYFGCIDGECKVFKPIWRVIDVKPLPGKGHVEEHYAYKNENNTFVLYDLWKY